MTEYDERDLDLWLLARAHTAMLAGEFHPTLVQTLRGLLPSAARDDCAIVVDLNKYRPGYNLQALLDRGVNRFILRMGGPTQWIEGDWRYQEDPTWRPYMDQLDALGVDVHRQVLGYFIHNPFEDWRLAMDYDVHVQLVNQWTGGGYMPAGFICDHEVAECWRGSVKITCTPSNLVGSLAAVTDKIYKKWRKVSAVYTARWFMDRYAKVEHETYFDNINKPESIGGAGMQRPVWYAWVPQSSLGNTVWESAVDCANALLIPNSDQLSRFLQCGSYSLYELWQFLFSFRTPEMVAAGQSGIDISVSRGTLAEFDAMFGLTAGPAPDTQPPTVPANLSAIVAPGAVSLTWTASTDNVAVAGYNVYRNGAKVGSPVACAFTDSGLVASDYLYSVTAFDAAGNESQPALLPVSVPGDLDSLEARLAALELRVAAVEAKLDRARVVYDA